MNRFPLGRRTHRRVPAMLGAVVPTVLWLLVACAQDAGTARPAPMAQAGTGGVSAGGSGSDTLDAGRYRDASSAGEERDASSDPADAADANASGIVCCDPSPEPSCCMDYGGHRRVGATCGNTACDGMAPPDAPWQLGTDEYGCPVWIEPENVADCCGCPADGGV